MKIGYIMEYDLELNPHLKERFKFREESFCRKISKKGDMVHSKLLSQPMEYDEIVSNANIMKKNPNLILVREPFLLDEELREKVIKWCEWANSASESEYNPL